MSKNLNRRWHFLIGIIDNHNYKNMVELGVLRAENAGKILDRFPSLDYVGVDLWAQFGTIPERDYESFYEEAKEIVSFFDNAELIREDTVDAASRFEDGSLDLVFIDADHSYEGVRRDIKAWIPKVKEGGMIAGHDYSLHHKGVVDAVRESFQSFNVWSPDNVWFLVK